MGFRDFILEHLDDDVERLLLNKSRWPEIDMALAACTIYGHRKIRSKIPSWHRNPDLIFPTSLCLEQCSSEFTAQQKTSTLRNILGHGTGAMRIADLTGGIGVDSYVFSKSFKEVLYNEMNPVLAESARNNFRALGCRNITVRNFALGSGGMARGEADTGGAAWGKTDCGAVKSGSVREILGDFRADVIYIDPARRSVSGKKVFHLEDCQPDILQLKEELLKAARIVAVKLSPMADISIVAGELGPCCRQIDIVSHSGECKEIVAWLDSGFSGECTVCAKCSGKGEFSFTLSEERSAMARLLNSDEWEALTASAPSGSADNGGQTDVMGFTLLEPDKALMKAGAFKLLCERYGLKMLDISTHYYITAEARSPIPSLFKCYRILKIVPLDKKNLKAVAAEYPAAEVTARNIPISSGQLRKKLGVKSSDSIHIFALKVTLSSSGNFLFITERIEE